MSNKVEYLDPEIANEGQSANNWQPGVWTNAPSTADEEYQPDIEPPHVNDYGAFKKHKHYRQYFRPYRYIPFPARMYHPTLDVKVVNSKEEVIALGPEWSPVPPAVKRIDMTGKSLPVKSETQKLSEALVAGLLQQKQGNAADPNAIAATVAAVMAAINAQNQPKALTAENLMPAAEPQADTERDALLALAHEKGLKVDGRWSNARLKSELGLDE
jgi:Glu-tRNA(Gln) amidotransferase subunit E-like FAD-binding protein